MAIFERDDGEEVGVSRIPKFEIRGFSSKLGDERLELVRGISLLLFPFLLRVNLLLDFVFAFFDIKLFMINF